MTRRTFIARGKRLCRAKVAPPLAIAITTMLAMTPVTVFAAAQVHGSPEAVSLQAQNASVGEILAILAKSYDVHYQTSANLEKQVTGTYEGSLAHVLGRLLTGYNFIVKTSQGRTEISVLGLRQGPVLANSPATPAPAKTGSAALATGAPAIASKPTQTAVTPTVTQSVPTSTSTPTVETPVSSESAGVVPPVILVAEGPMPPLPTPGATGPVPEVRPSAASAPMPTPTPPGATPVAPPEPKPSTVEPPTFIANPKPVDNSVPAPAQGPKSMPAPPPAPK